MPKINTSDENKRWFVRRLFSWYRKNKRDLPWRRTHDPYAILVSEIMLQQTQVDRVIPKYEAFLKEFPTAEALATASTATVIRAWSGLGYNRRALYLQRTARTVVEKYQGHFPKTVEELEELPGIGPYTARAVACFAFLQPTAPVDVNIARVLHRWFYGLEIPKPKASAKEMQQLAEAILPKKRAYDWNHALMDFGALVSPARRPQCPNCPMRERCAACPQMHTAQWGSIKRKKTVSFVDSNRYWRGHIVEFLRERPKHRSTITKLRNTFPHCPPDRLGALITGLVRDGLLTMKNHAIALPQ